MAAQRNIRLLLATIVMVPVIGACQTSYKRTPESYIARYQDYSPVTERFQVCNDVHCQSMVSLSLEHDSWRRLAKNFDEPAETPGAEREQIKSAIGLFEEIVGPMANTNTDHARNQTGKLGERQLDCIAETVNTTTYMLLFREQGWLRWHDVSLPHHRGFFTGHWPHNAAVIREKQTGDEYVVDSFFYKNGEPPIIVPAALWQAGYDPDE